MNESEISRGFDKIAEDIESLWSEVSDAGFTYPAFFRDFTLEFAIDENERELQRQFWKENTRESLARAPLAFKSTTGRSPITGLAFYSRFLDESEQRGEAFIRGEGVTFKRVMPFEAPARRIGLECNRDLVVERIAAHWLAEVPNALRDHAVPWRKIGRAQKRELLRSQIEVEMGGCGIRVDPLRSNSTLPIFLLGQLSKGHELILFVEDIASIDHYQLEVRFAVVAEGKPLRSRVSSPANYIAMLAPVDFVPFFDRYAGFITTADFIWGLRATAFLAARVKHRISLVFGGDQQ